MSSHTLAPTTICDLSHGLCWRPLTDLGHISSVTYVCHPLWFACGHRKGILTSPLKSNTYTETLGEADHSVLGGRVGSHERRRGDACHEKGNTQCKTGGPFFFLIVCFTRYLVFRIAVLPHRPGVVYYHLLLRRETRIPRVAPFSFRIGIWDLFVHRGQKSYTPTAFGKLWTTPGVRCMKHASS